MAASTGGDVPMFLRLAVPLSAALAAILVFGNQRGADAPAPAEPVAASAIDLLGEAWTINAPEPVGATIVAAPAPAADRTSPSSDPLRPAPRPQTVAAVEPARPGLRPLPRPDAETGIAGARAASSVVAASTPVGAGGEGLRWVVRTQGTGAVVAELPLAEALAFLESQGRRW
jgi:hypothetical protein